MVRCLVNDIPRRANSGLKTWGELLDALDGDAASAGLTVTAVRFDGVDQPTFRGEALVDVPLSALDTVDVECTDRHRLLRSVLATAELSLPTLAASAGRLAAVYRAGDLEAARQQLAALIATIRTLTRLTLASSEAAGLPLAAVDCRGESGADVLGAVAVALEALIQHHDAEEWPDVADTLERDLAPTLLHWSAVFDAMREGSAA